MVLICSQLIFASATNSMDMNSSATSLERTSYDEISLLAAMQEVNAVFDREGLAAVISKVSSFEQDGTQPKEKVKDAIASLERHSSDANEREKDEAREDYRDDESMELEIREKGTIDVDEISQSSTTSRTIGKTKRTDVEMILNDSSGTSLLLINSEHFDGADLAREDAARAKRTNQTVEQSNQGSPAIPTAEYVMEALGKIEATLVQFSHQVYNGFSSQTIPPTTPREGRPEKCNAPTSDTNKYIQDEFSLESMSGALDRTVRNTSEDFVVRMEKNIQTSIREFNAHHEHLRRERKALERVDRLDHHRVSFLEQPYVRGYESRRKAQQEQQGHDSSFSETEPLTFDLIKTVVSEEVVTAAEEIKNQVVTTCQSSESRPRRARCTDPVDVDEVSLSTTKTESARKRREEEHRLKSLKKAGILRMAY